MAGLRDWLNFEREGESRMPLGSTLGAWVDGCTHQLSWRTKREEQVWGEEEEESNLGQVVIS